MNTDLSHLPEAHRADLARLVEFIRSEVENVQQVVLFGSFARGDWKTEADLPPPEKRRSGHPSDYDMLVITDKSFAGKDPALWERLSRKTIEMGLKTPSVSISLRRAVIVSHKPRAIGLSSRVVRHNQNPNLI